MNKRGIIKLGAGILVLLLVLVLVFSSLFSSASPKSSYIVGEEIKLDLSQYAPCSLKIQTPSTTSVQYNCDDKFSMKLKEVGTYTIDIKSEQASERIEFQVYPNEENVNDSTSSLSTASPGENLSASPDEDTSISENTSSPIESDLNDEGLIRLGEPVKNKQTLNLEGEQTIRIKIPESAENVSLHKTSGEEVSFKEKQTLVDSIQNVISGNNEKSLIIQNAQGEVQVEYTTPGPEKKEAEVSEDEKKVSVSSEEGLHYEGVLAYTNISNTLTPEQRDLIKVYWEEENKYLDFEAYDKDGNGLLDYIEWVVPHLSEQNFIVSLGENSTLFNFSTGNTYFVNDTLKFNFNGLGNYELIIITPSGKRISRVATNDRFFFSLLEEGKYSVSVERGNGKTFYEFTVVQKDSEVKPNPEDFIQKKAEINKPVEWTKTVDTSESKEDNNLIEIPNATEVKIEKENGEPFTDYTITSIEGKSYVQINENLSEDIKLNYFTEAPVMEEQTISEDKKEVTVSSPSDVHYENVLSYTQLPKEILDKSQIKVYWKENNSYLDFEAYDKDGNGLLDYIEWIVPHLSTQTFEIIIVTKAEHLSSDKTFISDIYPQIRKLDDTWSETINPNEYARITFERNLTSKNDITIFPKVISGNPIVEVYEKDGEAKIAEFNPINNTDYNKIYLTNFLGNQDTFDLKVVGGALAFDYIVDPLAVYNSTYTAPTCSSTDSPCIANSTLLRCVGSQASPGPEPNAPNSIDTCADAATSGTCYTDESVENITVTDLSGSTFTGGDTVNATISWYCYGTMDRIAVYYTSSISSINWQNELVGTTTCPAAGYYTRNVTFTLDNVAGSHAIRAIMLYNAPIASACPTGNYRDQDDLVFQVDAADSVTRYYNMNASQKAYWGQPASSNLWLAGTNATSGQYTNLNTENSAYAVNAMAGGTTNYYPFWRFNFTINEEVAQINSISIKVTGFSNSSNANEPATLYLYNVNSTWMNIGTVPKTTNTNVTFNIPNGIGSYMNRTNHQIMLAVEGTNFDAGESLVVDHARLGVTYIPDTNPPTYNQVSINDTYAGQINKFSAYIDDDIALNSKGGYIFSTNNTGIWVNDSTVLFTTTPSWANVTKILNATVGKFIGYMWYFNDTNNNKNFTQIYTLTTTDGYSPAFTTIPSNASLFYGNQSLLVKFVATDETGFSYYSINDTRFSINQTGFLSNVSPMAVGNYEINVSINDTSNNINWTRYRVQINKSNYFDCGIYFNVATPQTYPNNFIAYTNCTTAYTLYRNGTSISNGSTINGGASYYNLTVQRTDSANYTNTVMSQFFTVNKNAENCQVLFNETSPLSSPRPFLVWANCTTPFVLARNGTTISNYSLQTLVGGAYNFSMSRNDTSNYTIIFNQSQFRINPDTTPPTFTIIPANASLFYGNQSLLVTFVGTDAIGFGYYFTNDTRFSINQTGFLSNASPMAVGNYEINVSINDTSNNIAWTRYKVQINKSMDGCGIYFNVATPQTYPNNFIVYTNCSSSYTLYRNGTSVNNASTINAGVGYYNLTVQRTDVSNYTSTVMSQFFTVNKNTENCRVLFNATSPINFPDTFIVWANCTSPFVLTRNGTTITNNSVQSLTAGAYNFSMARNDTSNYTILFNQTQFIINPSPPPIANQIECEQGGTWKSCSQVDFTEVLTRVRVNCTGGYVNASFNLTNIPDMNTFFSANSTSSASGFLIYDNPDLTINDSGQFLLNATCYGAAAKSYNSTSWNVSWGNLSVTLINPISNLNVNPLELFNFTVRVNCTGGECGNVNVTLDPANWWNSSWMYRTAINLPGVGVQLTDFQIEISKNLTDIYNHGKLRSDCSDIRFANGSSVEMPYWTESCYVNGSNSTFWIKVPSIAASGNTTIYMYYGNSNAANISNASATFDFYDPGNNVGAWTIVGAAGQTAAQGLPQPSYYATSVNGDYMYKNISLTANRIIEYDSRSDGLGNLFFLTDGAGNGQHMRLETRGGNNAGIGAATTWTSWSVPSQTCANLAINTWFNFKLVIDSTTAQAYIDNVACGGAYTFTNNGGYIGLVGDNYGGTYNTWWDNLRVRKYSSTTPDYSFGGEENGPKGIIPMNSGVPFYTISQNPRDSINSSCLLNMKPGTVCNITWRVNATGEIGSIWDFFVFANNTNYLNYFNVSSSSSHINITIGNLPPSVPELNFPANASPLTSIGEFNWSNSTDPTGDAVSYIIEISNSSSFSTFIYRNASIPERADITGVTPTGITQEGAYYWRVRSTDLKANSSWSETRVFYYDLYSPNVTLIFPGNLTVNSSSNTLGFIYNVSDISSIQSCNLIINDSINDTSTNITKNVNLTFTVFLPNSFYSWKINCTDAAGRVGVSETRFLTTFAANNPPVAREIQCEKNGIWYNCSSIGFGNNLTRVRVKCTDIENGIMNATFNLTNLPDSSNYFYNLTAYSSGGYWILNNTNSIINDSGDFNLLATCFDNGGLSNSNSTTWSVPWGSFLIDLINPNSDSYAMRYQFFNFTARVNCTGGECGNANVTLDPANWWNDSWDNRKIVNVTNFGSTVLSNFTVYINLTKESEMQNDFDDIRFVNGSCGSSSPIQLNYEIENYTSSMANVWVKIPSLATGINQICMYYGNPSATNGQNKIGTWNSNYKMVLHLSESGTGTRYDSSQNANNGTPINYDGNEHVSGKIDGADQILTDDYINTTYLQNSVTQYTISAWINTATASGTIVQDRGSGAGQSITFGVYPPCGGGGCTGASAGIPGIGVDSNAIWIGSYGTSRVDDGNWHYVVGVFNSTSGSSVSTSNFRIYVDGKYESGSSGSTGSVNSPLTGLSGTKIGYHEAWAGNYFNGYIDEVTIATTAFSNDWINQSYQMVQNQNNSIKLGEKETRAKGILSTVVGATPFYTTTNNPLNSSTTSCLVNMKPGNTCNLTWNINATGTLNSVWEFFVSANNLNYTNYFNTSSDSSTIDITIASQLAPSVPQLYRPLNATAFASVPNLNWTNSTDINGDKIYYILQVSNVSDFSTISFANYSIPETATPTGKTPTGITIQGAYYWRVKATDLIANSSWSETRVFYYDLTAPNLTFINQTGEDNRIINSSNWLFRGENMSIFVNSSDINVDKVWIVVWSTVIGGVEKIKTFFTYIGGFLWVAKVSTNQVWGGLYNYTIYTNDTLGSQTNYSSNFTVLGGNATINLTPSSTNSIGNITVYGHINLTNSTNLTNYPINIWLNGNILSLSNLTGEGTYDFYQEFQETSGTDFSRGIFYNTEIEGNQNVTLSPGMTSGNFTKVLDAGARVSWNNLSWNFEGASCSGVFSYQEGDSNNYVETKDTYITSGAPTTNYGTSSDISVDGSPYSERGLIRFDNIIGRAYNQIPENATINNANLTFQISDAGNLVSVYEVTENWTEADSTYNQRLTGTPWGSTGCSGSPSRSITLEDSFTPASTGDYTINVTNSMKNWVLGNSQNYGWVFDMPTSNGIIINSKESSPQSERPLLMVGYQANECTNMIVYVRTSNDKITWTSWQQVSNGGSINDSNVYSRYLQYRTELTSVNSALTPVLEDITVNYTAIVTDTNGNYRYNFTNPSQFGDYNITVNTSFKTILINNSAILSVQTGVPPNVSLISPNNSQWFSNGYMNLTYNATDLNNNFASSKLIINGALNQTNATVITNYAYNNFTINFSSGQYNWTVNVTDTTGYETTTAQRTFYIDLINPNVSLTYPGNLSTYTVNQLNLSFNATDNMDTNLTCSVVLDGNTIRSGVGAASGNITNVSSGTLISGTHRWNVTCTDNAFRNFTSSTYLFDISDTPPNVTLVSPAPNYLNSDWNISFTYNATDNTGFTNCSLIINNTYRIWNTSAILNNLNNTFDITGLSEGKQNWTVECFDLSGTPNKPSPRNFSVDLNPPTIALNTPSNAGTSPSSKVYFNFTVNDTIDTSLSCNLTINGVVMNISNVSSGNLTIRPISNLTDGLKSWNVTCIDDSLHSNTSETWTVNITEAPYIFLNTSNNSRYNQSSINLTYTPSDNTNLSSCRLYLDGVFNQSNSTAILNNQANNFTLNGIADGTHTWYVNCSDYFGISNQSITRTFYIDHSPPVINLYYPNGDGVFSSNVTFNFTVIDSVELNLSCNLTVNSSVVASNFTSFNGSMTNKTIAGISDGYHVWNVTCWDGSGNTNTSNTFNFTRYTNPQVALTSPGNNTWFNTSAITLFYLPDDDEGIVSSSLFINGAFNRTNSSPITNHDYNNFSITSFGDGIYYWNVNVTDPTGLTGIGAERKIYIDSQSPSLLLNSPNGTSIIATNNVTFNFTVLDNLANYIRCNFTLDGEQESSGVYSNNSNVVKYSVLSDGNHSWNVDCVDNASNINNSNLIYFTVEAPPNVTLNLPSNNFRTTSSSILFNYTPIDPIGLPNCSFYLDGIYNATKTDILFFTNQTGRLNNFTINGISEGMHTWTVNCTDSDNNNYGPDPRTFYRDISPPLISLELPDNNSGIDYNKARLYFNWTATDTLDTMLQCNVTVDGVVRILNEWVTGNVSTSKYISTSVLNQSEHSWNISCWDQLKNINTSELRKFNLTYPDFFVNSSDIYLNETNPKENQSVIINATIYNLAGADIENITVRFYNGDPDVGGLKIGTDILINLSKFNKTTVTKSWLAQIGSSPIFVVVDPPLSTNGSFNELNESNNKASKNFSVGSWQFFYGDVLAFSNEVLANSNSSKLISWSGDGFGGGNVYVTDYDSYVSWSSLQAIGKTKTNTASSSDFSEIDSALNSSLYQDSVYSTYTNSGTPKAKLNLSSFGKMIPDVPIVNSTNNSNFVTGILWDTSDDIAGGEFDSTDKEDLVFVAPINKNAFGTYGTYDYEIRVPAKLREYKLGDSKAALFYVELP